MSRISSTTRQSWRTSPTPSPSATSRTTPQSGTNSSRRHTRSADRVEEDTRMSTQTYDALGFDPAPGVPASVAQLVTALSKVGNQLNGAHGTLARVGKADDVWEGDAAAGFAKKVGELPKYLADGHASLI